MDAVPWIQQIILQTVWGGLGREVKKHAMNLH